MQIPAGVDTTKVSVKHIKISQVNYPTLIRAAKTDRLVMMSDRI